MKIKPIEDRVVVKPDAAEERSKGGIVLPDVAKEKPVFGTVEAVGPGRTLENGVVAKPQVKVGDRVLYGKYAGADVKIDDREVKILKEADLYAIVG